MPLSIPHVPLPNFDYSNPFTDVNALAPAYDALFANLSDEGNVALNGPTIPAADLVSVEKYISYYERLYPEKYGQYSASQALNYVMDDIQVRPDHTIVLDSDGNPIPIYSDTTVNTILAEAGNYHAAEDWAKIKCPVLVLSPDWKNIAADYPYLVDPELFNLDVTTQTQTASLRTSNSRFDARRGFLFPFRPYPARAVTTTARVANTTAVPAAATPTPAPSSVPSAAAIAEALNVITQYFQLQATDEQRINAHFKQAVPQTTFVIIPNSTHYLYLEQPAATAAAMRTFLAAHDGV